MVKFKEVWVQVEGLFQNDTKILSQRELSGNDDNTNKITGTKDFLEYWTWSLHIQFLNAQFINQMCIISVSVCVCLHAHMSGMCCVECMHLVF